MQIHSFSCGSNPLSTAQDVLNIVTVRDDKAHLLVLELAPNQQEHFDFDSLDFDGLAGVAGLEFDALGAIMKDTARDICPRRFLNEIARAARADGAYVTPTISNPTPRSIHEAFCTRPLADVTSSFYEEPAAVRLMLPTVDVRDVVPVVALVATHLRHASIDAVVSLVAIVEYHKEEEYLGVA